MHRTRKLYLQPWLTRPIIGVFLLWAGMFTCFLPQGGLDSVSEMLSELIDSGAMVSHEMGEHRKTINCVESGSGATPTYCKTDGRTSLVSDLGKLPVITYGLLVQWAEYVRLRTVVATFVPSRRVIPFDLSLLFCTFLK